MKNSEITTVAHFGQRQIRQARHELVEFGAGVVDPRFVKLSVANKPSNEKRVATCFIIGEERPSPFFIEITRGNLRLQPREESRPPLKVVLRKSDAFPTTEVFYS